MRNRFLKYSGIAIFWATSSIAVDFPIVDTGQIRCYDDRTEIQYPESGQPFFGQDAQYYGNQPSYRDNGDGTVTDLNTGLMWQADPGIKMTYVEAVAGASKCQTGGYSDWRLPTIKVLYSLIQFSGSDSDPRSRLAAKPFIDTIFFKFQYGNVEAGERIIDSQWATSTIYVDKVMQGQQAMFGVNFADGRIKGYPTGSMPGRGFKTFYVIYVRGHKDYGENDFVDNGDGTITDHSTGLMWQKADSSKPMNWQEALEYAENMNLAGHNDWRLPNAKELQSIVDYSRSPDTSDSAAIDPIFSTTPIRNEGGQIDYAFYWTSTTHARTNSAEAAVYLSFGRALGFMNSPRSSGEKTLMDVHGTGAQRSDPKSGDPKTLSQGHGPQGDVQRIYNMVRCVRGGEAEFRTSGPNVEMTYTPEGGGFVARLDRDGDGKVSRMEFDGPADHFDILDKNEDGYLSEYEAPLPPGGRL